MSDNTNDNDDIEVIEDVENSDELRILKDRARLMGIAYSNNIGVDALRAKIASIQSEREKPLNYGSSEDAAQKINPLDSENKSNRVLTTRERLLRDELRLVRCRITNLNPNKKDLPGEIFTVANEFMGTVRKLVPFTENEDGWHIPHCIYTMLKEKRFVNIRTNKTANGQTTVRTSMSPEYAIEVLPQLTKDELNRLALAQKAAGLLDDTDEQL